jgi:hypothetical protein
MQALGGGYVNDLQITGPEQEKQPGWWPWSI